MNEAAGREREDGVRVVSVNVGAVRTVEWFGRQVTTGIWKEPVAGPVTVAGVNLDGDDQADRRVHGGPDKAVYAYASEDYDWWSEQLGAPLAPGTFGENLTLAGIDPNDAVVGDVWQVGATRLRVTQPRLPCFKLGMRMGDAAFVQRFEAARRYGMYLAIETEGAVAAGDAAVRVARADGTELTIGEFARAYEEGDEALLQRIADHPCVAEDWRDYANRALARRRDNPR